MLTTRSDGCLAGDWPVAVAEAGGAYLKEENLLTTENKCCTKSSKSAA